MIVKVRSAFVITCLALFSEVIDGYLLTRPRDTIALLGDRVELDCVTNTSRSVDWRLIRDEDWISRGNKISPHISDSFRILSIKDGQFALVVNPVAMSLAGGYECHDKGEENPSSAEVTVLDGTPSCDESTVSPSLKIVCSFRYAGNLRLELEWMSLGNSSWTVSCKASNNTVDCLFESCCSVNKMLLKANTFLSICIGENNTCEWVSGNVSSGVGLLQVKGHNKTVGSWHCTPTGVPDTTTESNSGDGPREISIILLLICVGVISTVIILLLFILHKNYGICRKNRIPHDVLFNTAMDSEDPVQTQIETITAADGSVNMMSIYSLAGSTGEEDLPVYAQVKKKKAVLTKTAVNGHDNGIFENSIYGYAKPTGQVTTDNFETDGIIYAELSKVPRDANGRIQGAYVASSEGFNTSMYASIDHNLRAPPLLQQSQSHHRHPN